jgi:two-component system cell cycle response regulator
VRELVRQSDIACRYGGEEFAIIIPDTDLESAGHIAERLRRAVEDHPFQHAPHRIPATVSIGLAGLKGSRVDSPEALVAKADEALYVAKEEGRNRVVAFPISTESDPPPLMP